MLSVRVIPSLLLKGQGFVKGKKFRDHKYIGDPINTIRIFNDKQADEILILDILCTSNRSPPNFKLLSELASESFMPLSYGGGITSLVQVEKLFKIGFEKVVLNSIVFENPNFIADVVSIAGSSSVVVSMDVKKNIFGRYDIFSHSGSKKQPFEPLEFSKKVEELGAGELIVCNIDRDGTKLGYDLNILHKIATQVSIPVIASGGAGSLDDFQKAVKEANIAAVSAGAFFVFHGKHDAVLIQYPEYKTLNKLFL
jgi:cyclase